MARLKQMESENAKYEDELLQVYDELKATKEKLHEVQAYCTILQHMVEHPVPPCDFGTNPVSILEQRVAKVFPDGILYSGVIVDYNEQKRWWQISYEDGDEEQLNFRELCILDTPPDFSCFRYCADG